MHNVRMMTHQEKHTRTPSPTAETNKH